MEHTHAKGKDVEVRTMRFMLVAITTITVIMVDIGVSAVEQLGSDRFDDVPAGHEAAAAIGWAF